MKKIKLLVSAALVSVAAMASFQASAAPMFDLSGINKIAGVVGDFGAPGSNPGENNIDNDVLIDTFGDGVLLNGFFGSNISLLSSAELTFEYIGKEAGYTNTFTSNGNVFDTSSSVAGDSFSYNAAAGALNFDFQSFAGGGFFSAVSNGANNSNVTTAGVADFFVYQLSDNSILVAFDDGYPDDNHDDLVLKITAIPEPSTLALLGFGLLGLGFARRKQA